MSCTATHFLYNVLQLIMSTTPLFVYIMLSGIFSLHQLYNLCSYNLYLFVQVQVYYQ